MAKYVIIDCLEGVNSFYKTLYNKNISKKVQEELKEDFKIAGAEIEVRKIPLGNKNNKKTIMKFINNLKDEGVEKVILSENIRKNEELTQILKENFNFFKGNKVINIFLEDIYLKYLAVNNRKDYEAELVLFSDDPQKTFEFLNKFCKKLKNVYIVADNYNKFDWVIKKIYEEFGFYIYFTEKITNVFLPNRIYINLAENADFIKYDKEKNNIIILNISGNSIMSESFLNTFCFRISAEFKEILKYFKYCDQECIEFLISAVYNNLENDVIKRFINEYNVKLKKICLKNY